MRSSGRRVWIIGVAALLGLGAGCRGFFVNPTLTSISITPNPASVVVGQSQPLVATGGNSDGSSSNITGQATWTSSDTNSSFIKLSSTGVVTGIQNTTTPITVTATFKGISGTDSVTVGAQVVTITCDSCSGNSISINNNGSSSVGFTSNVAANWSSSDSNIISISGTSTTSPTATLAGNTGTVTITATAISGGGSGTLQVTVTQ